MQYKPVFVFNSSPKCHFQSNFIAIRQIKTIFILKIMQKIYDKKK